MKRSGKRSRSGDKSGSSKRHAARPHSTTINLTSPPEDSPASNPGRHLIPNSAFQSTHFKFQSNLNRPLVSAQITILMTEEINQVPPISCINPNSSDSSDHSSAQFAMAAKTEDVPVIQVDSPSPVPPLSDCINLFLDPDAGNIDKEQEGNVEHGKEGHSHDDACQPDAETQGDDER